MYPHFKLYKVCKAACLQQDNVFFTFFTIGATIQVQFTLLTDQSAFVSEFAPSYVVRALALTWLAWHIVRRW